MGTTFMYLYSAVILALAGYLAYVNFKSIKQARELYKEQDLSKFTLIDIRKKWLLFYAIMLGMVIILLALGQQTADVTMISIGLIVIIIAELGGTFLRYKLYYNEKHFIYEAKMYRIKSIRTIIRSGRFIKRYEIAMFDGTKIMMPKQFAEKLEELSKKK